MARIPGKAMEQELEEKMAKLSEYEDGDSRKEELDKEIVDIENTQKEIEDLNTVEVNEGEFPCAKCEFIAKSEFGLMAHLKKHDREELKAKETNA